MLQVLLCALYMVNKSLAPSCARCYVVYGVHYIVCTLSPHYTLYLRAHCPLLTLWSV